MSYGSIGVSLRGVKVTCFFLSFMTYDVVWKGISVESLNQEPLSSSFPLSPPLFNGKHSE